MAVNQELFDAETLHNIRLEFLKNGIVKRMLEILSSAHGELTAKLRQAIDTLEGSSFNKERIEGLLSSVYQLNSSVYGEMTRELNSELSQFAEYEAGWQVKTFETVLPAEISFNRIAPSQVYAVAVARPFNSRLLSEWSQGLEYSARTKIRDAVRLGVIQNETTDQVIRRIRGTKANAYKDGLIDISRREAQTVVRTAIAHTANVARSAVYEANADLIKYEMWHSTLDSRTSPTCQELDGKRFEVGKGIYPPAHMNCRSVRIPVLKSWRELGFEVDDFPPTTRASMDGQVPDDLTYSTWLKRQSVDIQDEVLGKARGNIYRETGAPLEKFINREGHYITLDKLKSL